MGPWLNILHLGPPPISILDPLLALNFWHVLVFFQNVWKHRYCILHFVHWHVALDWNALQLDVRYNSKIIDKLAYEMLKRLFIPKPKAVRNYFILYIKIKLEILHLQHFIALWVFFVLRYCSWVMNVCHDRLVHHKWHVPPSLSCPTKRLLCVYLDRFISSAVWRLLMLSGFL